MTWNVVRRAPVLILILLAGFATLPRSSWADPSPRFFSDRTRVAEGQTRVIPFQLDQPSATAREFPAVVTPPNMELLSPAKILAGETIGYLRVRGQKTGPCRLQLGGAALAVTVNPAAAEPLDDAVRIVSPAVNAAVWGQVSIGVESSGITNDLRLRLPNGQVLQPSFSTPIEGGLTRRFAFELDADSLPPGAIELVAIAPPSLESAPLRIHVVRVATNNLVMGECEDYTNTVRTERFGLKPLTVVVDATASGGKGIGNASSVPAVRLPFRAPEDGYYQVMIVARGECQGGAFPSVGLYIDELTELATSTRLVKPQWQRVPLGRPVFLAAGDRILTPYFINDFYVPKIADRNLSLDRFEIAAVNVTVAAPGPRIGFKRPWDGCHVAGRLNIAGFVDAPGATNGPAPRIALLVNGQPHSEQQTIEPTFWLERGELRVGTNTIQLVATDAANHQHNAHATVARSAVQQIVVDPFPGAASAPGATHRFSMRDERWDDEATKYLTKDSQGRLQESVNFYTNARAELALPEQLSGRYQVLLESRGEQFKGPPIATLTLAAGGKTNTIGDVPIKGWWKSWEAGSVELLPGPKTFSIGFTNDAYEPNVGDRNLWLKSVVLRPLVDGGDKLPPEVKIRYPKNNQAMHGVDAVVASAIDNVAIAWGDLVIDGKPQDLRLEPASNTDNFVFPLLLRGVPPGPHQLAVRIVDEAGQQTDSAPISIQVAAEPPTELGPYARAVRLLNRFAYGPDSDELAAMLTMGREPWLIDRLGRPFSAPAEQAAWEFASVRFPQPHEGHVRQRVVQHLLATDNPVRARFVLWAQNHFSTWMRKAGGPAKSDEHLQFAQLGVASFDQLLFASATSPAMLVYLDQNKSVVGNINENYAREIMELHTLGVDGGYRQQDVTELACLLTGWTMTDEAGVNGEPGQAIKLFRFVPELNDPAPRRVIGTDFVLLTADAPRADRIRWALETLATHPSTARFIARKLAEHYVAAPAPDRLVAALTRVFHETGGDMKSVLIALADHSEFYGADRPPRLTHPPEFSARLARVTRNSEPWMMHEYLDQTAAALFDRATPDGYPETDDAYDGANALLQRWRLAKRAEWMLNGLMPGPWRNEKFLADPENLRRACDIIAVRVTGTGLSGPSSDAAAQFYGSTTGNSSERIKQLATFVGQLPEMNLK